MDLTIRDARPTDAQALATLIGELGYPTSAETVSRRLEGLRSSGADRVIVAELAGEVIGLANLHTSLTVEYDEPVAKLNGIVVDERHRRRGIGEAWWPKWRRKPGDAVAA